MTASLKTISFTGLISLFLYSCMDKDDPNNLAPPPNATFTDIIEATPCEQFPMSVGNYWVMEEIVEGNVDTILVFDQHETNGESWFEVIPIPGRTNFAGRDTLIYDTTFVTCNEDFLRSNNDQPSYEGLVFKGLIKNPQPGDTWTDTLPGFSDDILPVHETTVVDLLGSMKVDTTTYYDVVRYLTTSTIKVRLPDNKDTTIINNRHSFYAKGIGPIRVIDKQGIVVMQSFMLRDYKVN